ncbi:hypothetical protein NLI96_g6054 [Meripilus lineatus]|uniref:Ubiquinone biosynthesis protein n=1 Tax=Meripilus lineatus TaxID=2056292 RepID=A0AAD5V2C9_9APHY|nr:hypothetical protein NLI96_g6054 [Physisporinus lineatus]
MAALRASLLQAAISSVKHSGFTRQTLANSVLSLPKPHDEPLSDSAVSSLFGEGDEARRTLIHAWLNDASTRMKDAPGRDVETLLVSRLEQNEPVVHLLPEAFALLLSPLGLPYLDIRPDFSHATNIANEACRLAGDQSIGPAWYTRRASIAAVYTAAELHQITSPETAKPFLRDLLEKSSTVEDTLSESRIFVDYVMKSWAGIIRSRGII